MHSLFLYIKYPSVALIISTVWVSTAILIALDDQLPVFTMISINIVVSILISAIGFRVDKQ